MTITQRIELRRLGYTKEEISELAELEKAPPPEAVPPETPPPEAIPPETQAPDIQGQLLSAINNLTLVLQNQKLVQTPQPETPKQETTEDIFKSILK